MKVCKKFLLIAAFLTAFGFVYAQEAVVEETSLESEIVQESSEISELQEAATEVAINEDDKPVMNPEDIKLISEPILKVEELQSEMPKTITFVIEDYGLAPEVFALGAKSFPEYLGRAPGEFLIPEKTQYIRIKQVEKAINVSDLTGDDVYVINKGNAFFYQAGIVAAIFGGLSVGSAAGLMMTSLISGDFSDYDSVSIAASAIGMLCLAGGTLVYRSNAPTVTRIERK